MGRRIVQKYIRIVFGRLVPNGGEEEMGLLTHVRHDIYQAPPAVQLHRPTKMTAEIKPAFSGNGDAPLDVDGVHRTHIPLDPDWIVCRKGTLHLNGIRFQGTDIEGQHSR